MFRAMLLLLLVVAQAGAAKPTEALLQGQAASVSAVQKVIHMLQDMAAKSKEEKNAEEVAFAQFNQWCTDNQSKLTRDVAEGKEQGELLSASISKLTSDAGQLGEEVAQLSADVAGYDADKKKQEEQRAKDHTAFLAEQKDYGESIDALERAIMTMQKQNYDRTGKEALLQLSQKDLLPAQAQAYIAHLLSALQDGAGDQAPEANAYEFQSGGIVQVLKNLLEEFRGKKGDCEKEEMNSQHASNMVVQDLVDSIENAKDDSATKAKNKASKEAQAAQDKEQLTSTLEVLKSDTETLKAMKTECSEKTFSFEEKQKLRAEEIEAIEKAVEIMSSEDVAGNAGKHLGLAQATARATALLQVGRRSVTVHQGKAVQKEQLQGIRRKVRDFLSSEGRRLHSRSLGLLAEKLEADPFAKVKKLIDDMITRLLEEANADAAKEGWCDTEIGQSKVTRNKLNEDIDGLFASIDEGKATIARLAEEMARLEQEVAELNVAMSEATKLRAEEKEKNGATIADAKAAQKAVLAATAILKDFYEKAGAATALLQIQRPKMGTEEWKSLANPNYDSSKLDKGHKAGMQTFGETYSGKQDEAGSVVAMLEVILSDFANLEADTENGESQAAAAYEDYMADSKQAVAVKSKKIEMDSADKIAAESALVTDTKDVKGNQDELLAAERYYDNLVPQCLDAGSSFDQRTKDREAEIQSLKEALQILSSPDIATSAL